MLKPLASAFVVLALIATAAPAEDVESLIAPGEKVRKLASGMKFTEGPAWIPAKKTLVFSDIPNSQLMQWHGTG